MNKARRSALGVLYDNLSAQLANLEEVRDAEQEAFDNLPESLQGSTGYAMEEAAGYLDDAVNSLQEALDAIQNAIGGET
jgi:hypothetical protein